MHFVADLLLGSCVAGTSFSDDSCIAADYCCPSLDPCDVEIKHHNTTITW